TQSAACAPAPARRAGRVGTRSSDAAATSPRLSRTESTRNGAAARSWRRRSMRAGSEDGVAEVLTTSTLGPLGGRLLGRVRHRDVVPLGDRQGDDEDEEGAGGDPPRDHPRGVATEVEGDDRRRDEHGDEVHHLDQWVDRRAGGVLEGVTDGVPDDRRLVGGRSLAAVVAVLDDLLRVVPRAAGVREEDGHEGTARDGAGEEAGERADTEGEADDDRGERGEEAGRGQLRQRVTRADV